MYCVKNLRITGYVPFFSKAESPFSLNRRKIKLLPKMERK